jgi:signal transduction histidine kinase
MQNIKLEESFNTIDKKISESNQIINNILAYSKIQVSHFETVRINNILRTCINEAKERFPNRPISIDEKLDFTDNLTIEADPLQIKQVFNNILNNSFDAINMLPGLIEISSEVKNSRVLILIKDNGEGIAKEDLGKVINPFFTTKAKGTGLGLTVCHQILSMHFGSLAIESDKGTGTVVTIALPVHRQDDE